MSGRKLAAAFGIAGGLLAGAVAYHYSLLEPVQANRDAQLQLFSVERGQGLGHVANRLEAAELIRDARAAALYGRIRGDQARLHAGEYELSPSWSVRTILDRITSGRVKTYEIVLPEGLRTSEIALRLEATGLANAAAFEEATRDAAFAESLDIPQGSLEGYLYPETYRLPRNQSARKIARVLVDQFNRVWTQIEPLARESTLSRHEIVTLASIVEKETAAPEERPLIAAVFLNRLRKGMRLETDPTVIYGIANFDGNLKRQHLEDRSNPYNTYRISGLPPGPIANPGIDSLRAVLEPAETNYLYFVSKNDGTHHFSSSYREHVNAVQRYQLRRRRR